MIKKAGIFILAMVIGMAAPMAEGNIPARTVVMAAAPSGQGETVGNDDAEGVKMDPSGNTGANDGKSADSAKTPAGKDAAGASACRAAAEPADGKTPDNAGTADGSGDSDRNDTARPGSAAPSDPDGSEGDGDMGNLSAVTLKIDNRHLYDGMAKTYRKGYTPVVEDGKAILVLPLLADGDLKDGRLTAALELGDPSGCPFVYKNYEKDVRLTEEEVDDGKSTVKVYYVRFDLKLASGRTDGVYPVGIQIRANDMEGNPIEQSFTTYVTIKGSPASKTSDEPVDDSGGSGGGGSEPAEEKPTSQPIMLVEKVQVKGGVDGEAQAGSEFTVQVTLKNTSSKKAVQNMVVTASCETPGLTLLNETNTTYIESIGKGKTAELTLRYQAGADTPEGKYDIRLAMSYDNEKAETLTSEGVFSITVRQPLMVEMTMPAIQAQVHAGDTLPLSFQFMNLGRSTVYNVRCELEGDGLVPGTVAFVGNMEAGTAQTADMNVFVDTLSGEELYGNTAGTATLRYEDAAGKEYTQKFDFETEIEKPVIQSVPAQQKEEKTAGQWWISVAAAGGLLLLIAAALFARRRYHEVV